MGPINLKLVLIIILAVTIGGLLGNIITKEISKSRRVSQLKNDGVRSLSFFQADPTQLLKELYDKEQHLFKMSKDSLVSLEATCYTAVSAGDIDGFHFSEVVDVDKMFDKIRSFYTAPGYYLEEGEDPVVSTRMALEIDSYFPQDLDQEIDLNWLKLNSLENENLEESKFDPQYQRSILEIYRYLPLDQKRVKTRIAPIYMNYYCNYKSKEIPDEDYLRKKYYQISIIKYLMGVHDTSSPRLCLKEDVEADKDRLNKISFSDLDDIKKVAWLYQLKRFYNLKLVDLSEFFAQVDHFYFHKAFKEKLGDKEPNLIGTFYGIRCAKL